MNKEKTPMLSERELTKERVRGFLEQFPLPYVGKPANEEWLNVVGSQVWIWEGQAKAELAREIKKSLLTDEEIQEFFVKPIDYDNPVTEEELALADNVKQAQLDKVLKILES